MHVELLYYVVFIRYCFVYTFLPWQPYVKTTVSQNHTLLVYFMITSLKSSITVGFDSRLDDNWFPDAQSSEPFQRETAAIWNRCILLNSPRNVPMMNYYYSIFVTRISQAKSARKWWVKNSSNVAIFDLIWAHFNFIC